MNSYEELYKIAKFHDPHINWYKNYYFEKSQNDLSAILKKLSHKAKLNNLTLFYSFKRELLPDHVSAYSIISNLKRKNTKLHSLFPTSSMFLQTIGIPITYFVTHPEELADAINIFFSEKQNQKNMEFFSFYVLPSLFGNFYVPELISLARRLAIYLLALDSNSPVCDYFCAAFFVNCHRFIDFLWEDYFNYFLTTTYKCSPKKYFDVFLSSLEKASSLLTTHHFKIAEQLFNISPEKFTNVFIKFIFEPTLNIRLKFDHFSHLYQSGDTLCFSSLKNVFDFILNNPKLTACPTALFHSINRKSNTDEDTQFFAPIGYHCYPCHFSLFELFMLYQVFTNYRDLPDTTRVIEKTNRDIFEDTNIGYLEIFGVLKGKLAKFNEEDRLLFPVLDKIPIHFENETNEKEKHQNQENVHIKNQSNEIEDFERDFNLILSETELNDLNILSCIEPREDSSNGDKNFNKKVHVLKNPKLRNFIMKKLINIYSEKYNSFEKTLILKSLILQYEKELEASIRIFNLYINEKMLIDDCIDPDSTKYKLATATAINSQEYVEMLCTFLNCATRYEASISLIITNPEVHSRNMLLLINIAQKIEKMEISDRIVVFARIFKTITDIIHSQKLLNRPNEYNQNYISLLLSISNPVFLSNLFESYCTFFSSVYSNITDDDPEIAQIKFQWNCLKVVLNKTIFKGRKDLKTFCFY
ncbi:hypothetical protein TRFO_41643 [Tritrichomonas foetus]|uniref:Uncharacterized protein n=1 Tax=Tritrichomonas foetus TaxID=1144522 RepID=A0A1J4KZV4_9EUKA|nr:hypothetical protein TRFO_41643 [Tritrichomonas foetus]|eukprot:OHT16682.1 hypothetical protein TRFO_41643 [Tritrichomonas foetus]